MVDPVLEIFHPLGKTEPMELWEVSGTNSGENETHLPAQKTWKFLVQTCLPSWWLNQPI